MGGESSHSPFRTAPGFRVVVIVAWLLWQEKENLDGQDVVLGQLDVRHVALKRKNVTLNKIKPC